MLKGSGIRQLVVTASFPILFSSGSSVAFAEGWTVQDVRFSDKENVYSAIVLNNVPRPTLGVQFNIPLTLKCVKGPAFVLELGVGHYAGPGSGADDFVATELTTKLRAGNDEKATITFVETLVLQKHHPTDRGQPMVRAQTKPFGHETLQTLVPVIAENGKWFELHFNRGRGPRYHVEDEAVFDDFVSKCVRS